MTLFQRVKNLANDAFFKELIHEYFPLPNSSNSVKEGHNSGKDDEKSWATRTNNVLFPPFPKSPSQNKEHKDATMWRIINGHYEKRTSRELVSPFSLSIRVSDRRESMLNWESVRWKMEEKMKTERKGGGSGDALWGYWLCNCTSALNPGTGPFFSGPWLKINSWKYGISN